MSSRDPQLLVEDILEAANKIIQYCNGLNFEEFTSDSKTIDAVVRNFEIIGEAASRLPGDFKDLHPTVDWQRIRGFRNRILHHYFGIDKSILWQVKETYLPELVHSLSKLK